ncbi:NAD(P)/FAD-dependent oxidoreductase [Candidatus Parcubacteria bacterium]|nr:NAD(P)/FAD-dependent oxidoreductase [Candidatus Parcubacteria bacterium]
MQKKLADEELWDVAVIGGGPAGMMAAGSAARNGAKVILVEKNKGLGKKLLITGGGRCNVTNMELDNKKLLAKFKESGKFLFSPFSQWSVKETLDFFHSRGMQTKEEAEQRVFPLSNTAQSVWDTLVAYLKESGVTILSGAPVLKLQRDSDTVTAIELKGGKTIRAKSFILATGGKSHPETGSTGDGYKWLRELGHEVSEESAALVPIALKTPAVSAAGVSLPSAKVTLYQNDVKQEERTGKMLFTHVGLSGPVILNMSRDIGELLKYGAVTIAIDLLPKMGHEKRNALLQEAFQKHKNKKLKNALSDLIPAALVSFVLERSGVDAETPCNSVTREARLSLITTMSALSFEVKGLLGMDKAVITAGGVALTEVDFKTMRSLRYENLFLVGDILNVDRPSGGYSLQLCWTTGFVAGTAAIARNIQKGT